MPPSPRSLLRLAVKIQARLERVRPMSTGVCLPEAAWSRCRSLARRLDMAERRGWPSAAAILRRGLSAALERWRVETARLEDLLSASYRLARIASLREIVDDLRALPDHYDDVAWDLRAGTLSVTTEPIALEGVPLGPFTICLDWTRLGLARPYRIRARAPNPAASDESVTHPHVKSGALCEGNGARSLRAALETGRLVDFFAIVDRILHTYHPGSPFVALSDWGGVCCPDCGDRVSQDEVVSCDHCGDFLCGSCLQECETCERLCCSDCLGRCAACAASTCRPCLISCGKCGSRVCSECLEDHERCRECHAQDLDSDEERAAQEVGECEAEAAVTRAPVQSHGVGQALVPA